MRLPILSLITILIINIMGLFNDWYHFFWFDTVLHFLGGFFVALLFTHYLKDYFLPKHKITNILIIVGATMFIGVVWEFAEYIASQALREPVYRAFQTRIYFMGDLDDTVADLLMDMLGGFTAVALFLRSKIKPQ